MKSNTDKRTQQLGMTQGAARNLLHKMIMFDFVVKQGRDICFQCGKKIEKIEEFSVEHKKPWLHDEQAKELFFDLNNIAFSHFKCNMAAARKTLAPCGEYSAYARGCRCEPCKRASALKTSERYYRRKVRDEQFIGTVWITDGEETKRINKNDLLPGGWRYGRTLKKYVRVAQR